eukprot:5766271-Prymnesium_polylepis.1
MAAGVWCGGSGCDHQRVCGARRQRQRMRSAADSASPASGAHLERGGLAFGLARLDVADGHHRRANPTLASGRKLDLDRRGDVT